MALSPRTPSSSSAPYSFAVSLGQYCITANTLRESNRRKFSTPFDWCYSNTDMINWCLRDDFSAYVNPKFYTQISNNTVENDPQRSGHHLFSRLLNRKIVFNHHNPLYEGREDLQYLIRCATRFRLVLQDDRRKLFIMTCRGKSKQEPSSSKLFSELMRRTGNFTLLIVYLVQGEPRGTTKVLERQDGTSRLEIYDMRCEGGDSGLYFKEESDRRLYVDVICEGRSFDLVEDPLKWDGNARAGKFGDLAVADPLDRRKESSEGGKDTDVAALSCLVPDCAEPAVLQPPPHTVANGTNPNLNPNPNHNLQLECQHANGETDMVDQSSCEVFDLLTQVSAPKSEHEVDAPGISNDGDEDADMQIQWPEGFGAKARKRRRIVASYFPVVVEDSQGVVEIDDTDPVVDLTNVEDEDKRIIEFQSGWESYQEQNEGDFDAHASRNDGLDSLIKKFKEGDEMDFSGAEALLPTEIEDFMLAQAIHRIENESVLDDELEAERNQTERDQEKESFQRDLDNLVAMGFSLNTASATLLRCGEENRQVAIIINQHHRCDFHDALDALVS